MAITYTLQPSGIRQPDIPVRHLDEEFDQTGFDVLRKMQASHFWYRGRHRFLLHAVRHRLLSLAGPLAGVDLGGGVGGWLAYLATRLPGSFSTLALADSSIRALELAAGVLPPGTDRYQVDLMNLGWKDVWDVAFLFDVLEHLRDDVGALRDAAKCLKPNGLLFVTCPALHFFWSYTDEAGCHLRRYTRQSIGLAAEKSGLTLLDARYFMFLLSPLYWLARRRGRERVMSEGQKLEMAVKAHKIPPRPLNEILAALFCLETPLGHRVSFPWGTSILGVFQKR